MADTEPLPNEAFDVRLLEQAGLRPRHIQRILGVSRPTASQWMNGKKRPHVLLASKIEPFMAAVKRALEDGKLPCTEDIPRNERTTRVLSTLREYMR
jgi:transcriptional regulator with XRE-family HTH domain